MKKIKTQTLKGFRDFLPEEARLRQTIIQKIKENFSLFGFEPLETPALEYEETLLGKYGEEADKLIYLFKDRGGRKVGLRYDQTVPLARVIAQYQNLSKPFKRYQIQPVWRAENPQKGRFREFIQCDIDIVGESSFLADVEIITCALTTAKNLGLTKVKMAINDRQNFKNFKKEVVIALDKLEKIGEEGVIKELEKKGFPLDEAKKLLQKIKKISPSYILEKIFSCLKDYGFKENEDFYFLPTLARGLDYYTGPIFELILPDYQGGSLGGGGRYDNLIELFTGKAEPAVGFSFGFDRLVEVIKETKKLTFSSSAKVLIAVFSSSFISTSLKITALLRKNNIKSEIYLNPEKKLDKQLKYADKKGIPYVVIIGPDEIKTNKFKLKDMKKKEQKEVDLENLIKILSLKEKKNDCQSQ